MIVIKKLFERTFDGDNFKDSYLKAAKYASRFVKEDNLVFEYDKVEFSKIKLIIYFKYDDNAFAHHRCEVCKQFKSHFYIDMNPDANCDVCRQEHYRKAIKQELDRIARVKDDLFNDT